MKPGAVTSGSNLFTHRAWVEFCRGIHQLGVRTCTIAELSAGAVRGTSPFVVLKHDIEDEIGRALIIARIEAAHGIQATYYAHGFFLDDERDERALREISGLGHEIGYHFDVLDNNRGDYEKAIREFTAVYDTFKAKGFDVRTVCPHGNPLLNRNGWMSNEEFLRNPRARGGVPRVADVFVDLPATAGRPYLYISDAGYSWRVIEEVSGGERCKAGRPLSGIEEILDEIRGGVSMIVSTHPHRWRRSALAQAASAGRYRLAKTVGRALFRTRLGNLLIDRYFHLAKRI